MTWWWINRRRRQQFGPIHWVLFDLFSCSPTFFLSLTSRSAAPPVGAAVGSSCEDVLGLVIGDGA